MEQNRGRFIKLQLILSSFLNSLRNSPPSNAVACNPHTISEDLPFYYLFASSMAQLSGRPGLSKATFASHTTRGFNGRDWQAGIVTVQCSSCSTTPMNELVVAALWQPTTIRRQKRPQMESERELVQQWSFSAIIIVYSIVYSNGAQERHI